MEDADVELALSEIAAVSTSCPATQLPADEWMQSGLKVTRIWGFGNVNNPVGHDWGVFFQVLNESLSETGQYINFNASNGKGNIPWGADFPSNMLLGIARLDYVISAAERHGIKIVLPLLNNWDDLGGISSYTTAFGGNSTSFYTDKKSQRAYKNYVKFIVERYKASSAIFAWELCNEPRCSGCPASTIYNWASDISAYIKRLDARHMVTLGDEGWFYPPEGDGQSAYSGSDGVDFVQNLEIDTLDYGTFHLYPDNWGYNYTWGSEWILQHDAACRAAGKLCVLEEYGALADKVANMQPWQETVLCDTTNIAYDSFWQFRATDGVGATDGYTLYYNTSDYQVLATQHAEAMLAKIPVANLRNGVIT